MSYTDDFIPTEEMRYWLILRRAFEKAFPKQAGNKTFEEKGVCYERLFRPQRSNSGKSIQWLLNFRITYPDGHCEMIEDPRGPNRRSDPARNWGLGRE